MKNIENYIKYRILKFIFKRISNDTLLGEMSYRGIINNKNYIFENKECDYNKYTIQVHCKNEKDRQKLLWHLFILDKKL